MSDVIATIHFGETAILKDLLTRDPALAAARDNSGISALMHALYRRRQDMVEVLLAASPQLDVFEAAALGETTRLTGLLDQDSGLARAWSGDGFTALHFACFFAREAAAKLLLERGADASAPARNPMKVAPLHSAAAGGRANIVRALLEHGAPANARQEQGWTALHEAAQRGDRAMVEVLLEHGADPALANDQGATAVNLAREKGHTEIATLLGAFKK